MGNTNKKEEVSKVKMALFQFKNPQYLTLLRLNIEDLMF
jgi:hypothetical protein